MTTKAEFVSGFSSIGVGMLFSKLVLAPVLEEVLFKSLAYQGLSRLIHPLVAAMLSIAAFTALHGAPSIFFESRFPVIALYAIGSFVVYWLCGLLSTILLHSGVNLIILIAAFLVDEHALVELSQSGTPGLDLLTPAAVAITFWMGVTFWWIRSGRHREKNFR